MSPGELAECASAVATFLAVAVALFGARMRRRLYPAKLKLVLHSGPPAFQEAALTSGLSAYWLRFWVENEGESAARRVQVFAAELKRKIGTSFRKDAGFLPANLRWTHTNAVQRVAIYERMGAYCELGYVVDPQNMNGNGPPHVPAGQAYLELKVEGSANQSHKLGPGIYRIVLRFVAE